MSCCLLNSPHLRWCLWTSTRRRTNERARRFKTKISVRSPTPVTSVIKTRSTRRLPRYSSPATAFAHIRSLSYSLLPCSLHSVCLPLSPPLSLSLSLSCFLHSFSIQLFHPIFHASLSSVLCHFPFILSKCHLDNGINISFSLETPCNIQ